MESVTNGSAGFGDRKLIASYSVCRIFMSMFNANGNIWALGRSLLQTSHFHIFVSELYSCLERIPDFFA